MDKDILRLGIIVVGGVVILAMILWSMFKNKRKRREINFYDRGNPLEKIDDSLIMRTEHDEFDIVPLGSALDEDYGVDPFKVSTDEEGEQPSYQRDGNNAKELPALIQFSIVARADEGFNGMELVEAFERVGLEYGSMNVFERVDENRLVDFAVASMVEPGVFPETGLGEFRCPGIVFFMQPREVDDPATVFEDFIRTIEILAGELDGVKWDHQRQPLSDETIQNFRRLLSR